jgi:DNA-binding transcriptional MerR regulator
VPRVSAELTIAEAARHSGLSAHTLRYYEQIGLIVDVERGTNGHRRYGHADLAWLALLKKLRTTGMPMRQLVRYAELVRAGDRTAAERREMLERHRAGIAAQIAELRETAALLDDKIAMYDAMEKTT